MSVGPEQPVSATERRAAQAMLAALDRSQAVVEFDPSGTVLAANPNFLDIYGYALDEIVGQHHGMLCGGLGASNAGSEGIWAKLSDGQTVDEVYKRVRKDGERRWVRSIYFPVLERDGRPSKIMGLETDVTAGRVQVAEQRGLAAAIDQALSVAEFDLDGRVLSANDRFAKMLGYADGALIGIDHRALCHAEEAASPDYAPFWAKLCAGEFVSGTYKRLRKGGEEVWTRGVYSSIRDSEGRPCKIVLLANDITASRAEASESEGKLAAIDRAQAVIEFDLAGCVLTANQNFLSMLGYSLDEVVGKHHRIFCDPDYAQSPEYLSFWVKLRGGAFEAGEYKRIAKDGRQVWIQATYNPIIDASGRPFKVVKFATDVTQAKVASAEYQGKVAAIDRAQAVIEFDLQGNVLSAKRKLPLGARLHTRGGCGQAPPHVLRS